MNSFGTNFRVSIFGESHGPLVGVTLDGVLPGLPIGPEYFKADIDRRRPGALGTTPRSEEDLPEILTGVYEGRTTGAPLTLVFKNANVRSSDYADFREHPRPGHADFTANLKFGGYNDPRGGGHFSGRLTLPIVAAGTVAKDILARYVYAMTRGREMFSCEAKVVELGGYSDASAWPGLLESAVAEGDSLGAIVECVVGGLPAGLGEPFWDSVESRISHAIFAIPGVRGIEFGDGFQASRMKGSEHNDAFPEHECCHGEGHGEGGGCCHGHEEGHECHHGEGECNGEGHECHHGEGEGCGRGEGGGCHGGGCCHGGGNHIEAPVTNHAGGINGGITNGNPIVFRVAFKPTASIAKSGIPGRHDTCFALRTPVIVEAMAALTLVDLWKTV